MTLMNFNIVLHTILAFKLEFKNNVSYSQTYTKYIILFTTL